MIRQTIAQAIAVTTIVAGFAFVPVSAEDQFKTLYEDALGTILRLRDDTKPMVAPDTGFPEDYVEPWYRALDRAFAPELVERDLAEAYERHLTEDAIAANAAFEASPLGRAAARAVDEMLVDPEIDEDYWAGIIEFIDTAPTEVAAPYVDFFEFQLAPERAEISMEGMYRMMAVGAASLAGPEMGERWIETARADGYTEAYVEEFFTIAVAALKRLSEEQVRQLADAVAEPGMVAYAEQSNRAFEEAYNAAIDRLEPALAEELDAR